ncbi:Cytochrome P450, E-class, group I [Phytophthora cactorum]|nr:Cytochrome P450, E-class, group I [Phytophthora cactorum]
MRALRDSMTATIQRHAIVLFNILQRASDSGETLDLFRLLNRFTFEAFAEIALVSAWASRLVLENPAVAGSGVEGELKKDIEVINATVLGVEKALARRCPTVVPGSSPNAENQQSDPMYLRDIVVNFLIAGRDTTAQTLSWFFLNLTKNPHVETAIRSEIMEKFHETGVEGTDATNATMQDVSQLVTLEAALKETLRLHPPVPMVPKYAKSLIVLATYAMARMQQVWGPAAAEFKPERWIDSTTGKLVSMLEMKLVVVGLLSRFHIEVQDPEKVTYEVSLTLPVKGSLDVKISRATSPTEPAFA